jgi:5S rRNA maturation endonuclease (ribonuclease M5)
MINIDFEELIGSSNRNSRGDHIIGDCPFCNKEGHFYFNTVKALKKKQGRFVGCWDCKKCLRQGNIVSLLQQVGSLHLIQGEYLGDIEVLDNPFDQKLEEVVDEVNVLAKEIKPPVGFKRVMYDEYLSGERGWTPEHYNKFEVGYTRLSSKLENYVIILIKEANRVRGYLARSKLSKAEIKEINKQRKLEGRKDKYLRYSNSTGAEFNKLLGGYEEIVFTTKWVILVEGIFDKTAVDRALGLDRIQEMKCCFTFGKDVSREQILKLKRKGIRGVILIQDPDAVESSKAIGLMLDKEFDKVLMGFSGEHDLGDSSDSEILDIFENLKPPLSFSKDIVQAHL